MVKLKTGGKKKKDMETKLRTAHEENFTQGEINKIIGVMTNYSINDDWYESFIYVFTNETYIFFDTMIEMFNYLLYGEKKMKRAYMKEVDFDKHYDSQYIDDKFRDILQWS